MSTYRNITPKKTPAPLGWSFVAETIDARNASVSETIARLLRGSA